MKKLLIRASSGAIYVALIVASLLWGNLAGFTLVCCLFSVAGILEFQKITKGSLKNNSLTCTLDILAGLTVTASLFLSKGLATSLPAILGVVALLMLLRAVMQLYIASSNPASDIALSAFSVIYVALPLTVATYLDILAGPHLMLLVFIMIWLNDTGAFLVGSAIGRHRLYERLSPKKSWEGFWGGAIFCIATGWLASVLFPGVFTLPAWVYITLGLVVCVFSTWGDLFESMLKRAAGVKDSGNLIPGHGGILDRIDSMLFVIPASAIFIYFVSR